MTEDTSFIIDRGRPTIDKAPGTSLRYGLDLSLWEQSAGDTVTSATASAGGTLVATDVTVAAGVVSALVSGGALGHTLPLTFAWQTAGGQTDQRTVWLRLVVR